MVLICGEHDYIDWILLFDAVRHFSALNLDAMAINVKARQELPHGGHDDFNAIPDNALTLQSRPEFKALFNQCVLSSRIAFPALLSALGPIDWVAYIGSHIYTRQVLVHLLMHRFSENIYSLVYKQLLLFSSVACRYAYYKGTPVHRLGKEFLSMSEQRHSWGWLENHRTVQGLSPCFWIANLQYLCEITDPLLFNLVAYSICRSISPDGNWHSRYVTHPFCATALGWCVSVLDHHLNGASYYLPEVSSSGDLRDLRTVFLFLDKSIRYASNNYRLALLIGWPALSRLSRARNSIRSYLDPFSNSQQLILSAISDIQAACGCLDKTRITRLNDYTLQQYLRSLRLDPDSPMFRFPFYCRLPLQVAEKIRSLRCQLKQYIFDLKCRLKPFVTPSSHR
jgi:hypothetical protein